MANIVAKYRLLIKNIIKRFKAFYQFSLYFVVFDFSSSEDGGGIFSGSE